MRIISGTAAGLRIDVPKGFAVRPTPDLVRQAIFNSLAQRVIDARVLDLFSGSGALGLECLSRGAVWVLSIEKSQRHTAAIRSNLVRAGLPEDRHHVRTQDVFAALPQLFEAGETFDLIVADPPFGEKNVGKRSTSDAQKLLDHEVLPTLLAENGLFVLGHARRDTLTIPSHWEERKVLKHGDSMVRFLRRSAAQ